MASYTSDVESRRDDGGPKVVCAWCGGVIRSAAEKAALRMCQPCFARMMREHTRAHQRQSPLRHASDR